MSTSLITSNANPQVKLLRKLQKASERREQNKILIEGIRETVLAAKSGLKILSLYVCKEYLREDNRYNLNTLKQIPSINYLSASVYETLAYREGTEGIIAVAEPRQRTLNNLHLPEDALLLVVEAVEKPGNLGAMLRTADAAGVNAVLVADSKIDIYNPNVIRSSLGTVFTVPLVVDDAPQIIRYLKEKNISIYAATPEATVPYYQCDYRGATAIVVGAEANGLSAAWRQAAHHGVVIPMHGQIDSLNVSVSAAIMLYEAIRQRSIKG
ncbi:MAG: RNA methyltransferase [Chitinophagales bacterium]|nr:RNA methyltransferase [Chitinophagales bacterium]MDW8418699.1 RNA methyltransferase [Chitinophagales bacterium]